MRLYALDGNGLAHWLYHANAKDGATVDLSSAIGKWFADFKRALSPTHLAVCLDGSKNWRYAVHAEYKSTRKAKPVDEAKVAQLRMMPEIWRGLGVEALKYDEFEADDAIASICNIHASDEVEVIVIATDKDLMQLVGGNVRQYDPRPNANGECVFYDVDGVTKKMGVPPHRVLDLLSMAGDTSDDIPGVEGWGKVTATNAILQTRSMAEIVRKAARGELTSITAKNQAKFTLNLDMLHMSRQLASLRYDVPVPRNIEDFRLKE